MEKFTASNGVEVTTEKQAITGWRRVWFGPKDAVYIELSGQNLKALIECLDAERDADLGRWRWPENPDYVVYPRAGYVQVVNEQSGNAVYVTRGQAAIQSGLHRAARAYFDAHSERRPWHDAEVGEVWVLDAKEFSGPHVVEESGSYIGRVGFRHVLTGVRGPGIGAPIITDASRVWPVDDPEVA